MTTKIRKKVTEILRDKAGGKGRFLPLTTGIFAILFLLSFSGTIASSSGSLSYVRASGVVPGLALGNPTIISQGLPTIESSTAQARLAIPNPPSGLGCATYSNGQWQGVSCSSQAAMPKPTEGGNSGVYGLTQSKLLTLGAVNFTLFTFTSEKDSSAGAGAFSIQANTNPFTGSNGDEDGIQFTEQSDPGSSSAVACIWQVDITTQSYPHTCVDTPVQKLAKDYSSIVIGSANPKTKLLNVEFCMNNNKCYSVNAKDMYGLAKHWTKLSGTLLGLGGGSEAEFTHPTASTAFVDVYYVKSASAFNTGPYTEETNNLNIKSNSVSCAPSIVCVLTSKSTN